MGKLVFTIYGLVDPRDYRLRYVGLTTSSLVDRCRHHVAPSELRKSTHRAVWLRELTSAGLAPTSVKLEVIDALPRELEDEPPYGYVRALTLYAYGREKHWIRHAYALGLDLVNTQHVHPVSDETRHKQSLSRHAYLRRTADSGSERTLQ